MPERHDVDLDLPSLSDPGQARALEELSGSAFFAVDRDQNVVAFSPGMERITGLPAESVLGRHCLNAFRCANCLAGCSLYERGEIGPGQATLFRADGSTLEVVKQARLVRDDAGQPVMGIEMVRLASEEGQSDGQDAQQQLDRMLGALGRLFVAADAELRVLRFSGSLPGLVGRPGAEITGMHLRDLLGPELFAPDAGFATAVLAGERREGWRGTLATAEGPRAVSVSAAAIGGQEGTCSDSRAAVLVVFRNDEGARAAQEDQSSVVRFGRMVAKSRSMQDIFRLVALLHDNDARVLITGESGTGKELVARAIHEHSHRSAGPFVVVNCGALPGELLESELFGHVRGAFTGAVRDKPGRFELADGGTLFLDEVGDLPLPLQVKLLRVLQEGTFERVGDPRTRTADVRILSATHVDLARAVAERRFRDDLYYRLRVVPIHVPPLRERREDTEPLVRHLLDRITRRRGRALRLSPSAMRALLLHDWPGNVRELENALEYATAVCEGQTIHKGDLPEEVRSGRGVAPMAEIPPQPEVTARLTRPEPTRLAPSAPKGLSGREEAEARRILDALEEHRYRRQEAADALGMSRWTLWRKMKEYRLA